MADIVKGLKNVWMKGMEAIGDTASNIANHTKYKVQEMNLINRRHEILEDFGAQAYALWQQGEKFPEELQKQLEELSRVDETLNTIRAERLAYLQTMEEEKAARAAAEEAGKAPEAEEDASVEANPDVEMPDAPVSVDMPDEPACCEAPVDEPYAPTMKLPEEEASSDASADDSDVPTLEIPAEVPGKQDAPVEPFEDPIEALMRDQAPAAPEMEKPVSAQRSEFEKKVGRALDTVQDKVSKLGRVIDRSVQNLAKVVLQNEDKQDKGDGDNK